MFSAKKNSVSDEQAMKEMMALLDDWHAPEPSPWFDGKMMARFREETQRPPESLFARLRDRWLFGNGNFMKPVMVGSLALLLVGVGGGYLEMTHLSTPDRPASVSATVQDLQILDNNDQAIQGMSQLLDDDSPQG
ncbi:hypothetical protein [Terriglobus roseus]|uniref:Uncharacterized protein n=1 Tax=Terriglobus roseus TaxID=392734 RepID=A0A1G7KYA5_9BACT|nr:hypothetical protein [Terriglobus roseus]SDF42064.1 hypothetical protein SAMN05444167_2354 [Terriglobus roseus]